VVAALRTDAHNGLDSDEARARLERLGTNQLTAEKTTPASKSSSAQFEIDRARGTGARVRSAPAPQA